MFINEQISLSASISVYQRLNSFCTGFLLLGSFAELFRLGLRFAIDPQPVPWLQARRTLLHQSDFNEAADPRFPFGCCAGDFFDVTASGAFEHVHHYADESAFAVGEV
jgi:hypothetical protein